MPSSMPEPARSWRGEIEEGKIDLVVEDDGNGFEIAFSGDQMALICHYGVIGMEERCKIIGAKLEIDTRLGKGPGCG